MKFIAVIIVLALGIGAFPPILTSEASGYITQQASIRFTGRFTRGAGILAEYDEPGPLSVKVTRTTDVNVMSTIINPTMAIFKVIAPNGDIVAFYDFTNQQQNTKEITLNIPSGNEGIWRFSFTGGKENDNVEISVPHTDYWGIRGEMALGFTETVPLDMYLYMPRTTEKIDVFGFNSASQYVSFYDEDESLIGLPTQYNNDRRRYELAIDVAERQIAVPAVLRVTRPSNNNAVILFNGVPGLLCPSAEAAERLKGGTFEAEGLLVQGPLQKRAREEMIRLSQESTDVNLIFEQKAPFFLKNPQLESLLFGIYGGLSTLQNGLQEQMLNPDSPYFGAFPDNSSDILAERESWESFRYKGRNNLGEAEALANMAVINNELNPAYDNRALIVRSALAAFYHFVSMQGDDIIREGNMSTSNDSNTHVFFSYPSFAAAYYELKDKIEPSLRQVWKQAVMAVGDKLMDYPSFQSNQWSHIINGHLYVYLATGEKRFLDYFERNILAYLSDNSQMNYSNLGRSPAGYFFEQGGPDGNYEQLNLFTLVDCYNKYKTIYGRRMEIQLSMKHAIEQSIDFQSLMWLRRADGTIISPTSINSRTFTAFANEGYPGTFMAYPEFPMAAARFKMTPVSSGIGKAGTMSYIINDYRWMWRFLDYSLERGDTAYNGTGYGITGSWTKKVYDAYKGTGRVKPAALPIEEESKIWDLPGVIAWANSGLYSVVFYSSNSSRSLMGGGPIAVYNEKLGAAVFSLRSKNGWDITEESHILHTSIAGRLEDDTFFFTGNETGILNWLEQNKKFVITSTEDTSDSIVKYEYTLTDNGYKMKVSFESQKSVNDAFLYIPIRMDSPQINVPLNNEFTYSLGEHQIKISWDTNEEAQLASTVNDNYYNMNIRNLKIPISSDGEDLTITFSYINQINN